MPLREEHKQAIIRAMQAFKGKPIPEERRIRIKGAHLKNTYEFKSPSGGGFQTDDIDSFAREHGFIKQHLYRVLNGKRLHHRGWTGRYASIEGSQEAAQQLNKTRPTPLPRLEALRKKVCKFTYEIFSPTGQRFTAKNLSLFCSEHDIDQRKMQLVVNGIVGRKSHRGWTGRKT